MEDPIAELRLYGLLYKYIHLDEPRLSRSDLNYDNAVTTG